MEQRLSFLTLVVRDVGISHAFYVERLGWRPELFVPGEVLMFSVADKMVLSLWQEEHFVAEVGERPARDGIPPLTRAHNCPGAAGVDAVLEEAAAAGAEVSPAQERDWGGYSGYFVDPDGFRWEVAFNPGPIGDSVL